MPGRHLDAAGRKLRLGGGGANTAIPLRHAGHDVTLVAPVGADAVAEWLLAKLQAAGIDVSAVARVAGDSTRSLVLVDPGGERTIVNLHRCREAGPPGGSPRSRRTPSTCAAATSTCRAPRGGGGPQPRGRPRAAARGGARGPPTSSSGSESDLPPAFLADPWAAGREIAGEALRLVVVTRGPRGAEAFGATEPSRCPRPS